ncbi:hypothetical protein Tco_1256431 [Tanacetum coccineum]
MNISMMHGLIYQNRHAAGRNLRRLSAEEAWETIKDFTQCDKHWKNPTSTISNQTIANLKAQLVENELVRVMVPKYMSWLDAYDEHIGDMEDKVDNPSTQRISMEVEPLDHTRLEDLGLSTCSHDLFLSSRKIPSVDELEPQLLPNFSPLDVNLGNKRGTDPPMNSYSLGLRLSENRVTRPRTNITELSAADAIQNRQGTLGMNSTSHARNFIDETGKRTMNIYNVKLEQFQVNTKFLNTLPPEWSKFVTDVKLVWDLHTTNIDQLHAYLGQHKFHANDSFV